MVDIPRRGDFNDVRLRKFVESLTATVNSNLDQVNEVLTDVTGAIGALTTQVRDLKKQTEILLPFENTGNMADLENRLEELEARVIGIARDSEIKQLEVTIEQQTAVSTLDNIIKDHGAEVDELRAELHTAHAKFAELERRIESLEIDNI